MNTSTVPLNETATTISVCAEQRAKNIRVLFPSTKLVLETCVGKSSSVLLSAYDREGISFVGNDIESKYLTTNPNLLIGDCFDIIKSWNRPSTVVFAPPLSKGCTGKREDALLINEVTPSYYDFIEVVADNNRVKSFVLVLPGATFSLKRNREQYHQLIAFLYATFSDFSVVTRELKSKNVNKYIDVYVSKE